MEGMGSAKDIIIMVLLIACTVGMAAFINRIGVMQRMDKAIAAVKSKKSVSNGSETFQSFVISAVVVGAGAMLILMLKQFDLIDSNFFPYVKKP
ncbi:MAG: hypothetical protein IKO47_03140 [Ruminococcus sp.]|nr:hypothetical protein [Ruminococcus sp.]